MANNKNPIPKLTRKNVKEHDVEVTHPRTGRKSKVHVERRNRDRVKYYRHLRCPLCGRDFQEVRVKDPKLAKSLNIKTGASVLVCTGTYTTRSGQVKPVAEYGLPSTIIGLIAPQGLTREDIRNYNINHPHSMCEKLMAVDPAFSVKKKETIELEGEKSNE